ncbi:ATP-binding protein [Streptomyces avermitilis]|uniref:sensor histidine kinase n=1 Tax=Streptomyces avermitilis TaxID=33903 RepID=UPI0033F98F6F
MSTNEVDAPARPAPSSNQGGTGGFAARWPFRRKLNALVGVPLAVVAALLCYLITDQVDQARSAAAAAQLVRDSAQVAGLVDRVENEHQQAILLSVRYEAAAGADARPALTSYRRAQAAVDAQVDKVRGTFGDRLPDTEAQALKEINGLGSLRGTIEEGYLPADNIDPAYTNAAKGLLDGLGLDRNAALAATFTGNLLDSLLRADAAHSSFETSVFSATTGDSNALIEFTNAVGSYELYTYQADRFARFATEQQADELSGIEHSPAQRDIAEAYAELQIDPSGLQANTPSRIRATFADALRDYPAYPKQAESRLKVAASLIGQIADRADDASSDAWWRAGLLLATALLGFVLWLAFSVAVRRSVVRPVEALTGAAQEVFDITSRELARVADDDAEDLGPPRLREVPVAVRDEIGELAEAFNHVQSTAAALLERQVLSRRNVAEMFGNVGRRVSNLTTRQLALIDAVERGETDPALLDRLYRIDHIAVRLRRNADSLMLLAGIRETVLNSGPTALTNVVRAALGQIEGYQRVQLRAETEVMVEPDIIGDLTLMVAELLENAVSFSPMGSPVEVAVRRTGGDGALIEIADHGLGMSAERLDEENARLIRRERLDLVPTKVLGLFVVGSLARRWDVGVTLSRTPGGGVTAQAVIPSSLLLAMSPLSIPAAVAPAPAAAAVEPGPAAPFSPASASGSGSGSGSVVVAPPPSTAPSADTPAVERPAAAALPRRGETESQPGALPRRVPRRETAPAEETEDAEETASDRAPALQDRTEQTPLPDDDTGAARPLRRRVRGATLRTSAAEAAQQAAHGPARPADAQEVRSALEEFEAAVERAHRDSGTGTPPPAPAPAPRRAPDQNDQNHQNDQLDQIDQIDQLDQLDQNHQNRQNHLPEGAEQ